MRKISLAFVREQGTTRTSSTTSPETVSTAKYQTYALANPLIFKECSEVVVACTFFKKWTLMNSMKNNMTQ